MSMIEYVDLYIVELFLERYALSDCSWQSVDHLELVIH